MITETEKKYYQIKAIDCRIETLECFFRFNMQPVGDTSGEVKKWYEAKKELSALRDIRKELVG